MIDKILSILFKYQSENSLFLFGNSVSLIDV